MPGIISGNKIGFIEPHEEMFTTKSKNGIVRPTSSKGWNLSDFSKLYDQNEDQFQPFLQDIFGATLASLSSGKYDGTLFRFPLRSQTSDLSANKYNDEKIRLLFDTLLKAPEMSLIFLKSLEKIEVYEKSDGSHAEMLFSVSLGGHCLDQVRKQRGDFITSITEKVNSKRLDKVETEYQVDFETVVSGQTKISSWLVIQQFGSDNKHLRQKLDAFSESKNKPWVGAAVQLVQNVPISPVGHLFCFLPLPLQEKSTTGLFAHINGYFSMAQNRRHLKWPSADQDLQKVEDKDILWNQLLVKEFVSKALVHLVLYCKRCNCDPHLVYALFPNPNIMSQKWLPLLGNFYTTLLKEQVIHTVCGKWANVNEVVFPTACMMTDETRILISILSKAGYLVADLPEQLVQVVEQYKPTISKVKPKIVRESLKARENKGLELNNDQINTVLGYILSDYKFSSLWGITGIIPTDNGGRTGFSEQDGPVYILKHVDAFPLAGMRHSFVDKSVLHHDILKCLLDVAKSGCTKLKLFSKKYFPELLQKACQDALESSSKPEIQLRANRNTGIFSKEWFHSVWSYIEQHFPGDLSEFEGLHLIPNGKDTIVKLDRQIPAIFCSTTHFDIELPDTVTHILKRAGAIVLETPPTSNRNIFQYTAPPTAPGFLSLIPKLKETLVLSCLEKLSYDELSEIRNFISGCNQKEVAQYQKIVKRLPIFVKLGPSFASVSAISSKGVAPYKSASYPVKNGFIAAIDSSTSNLAKMLNLTFYSELDYFKKDVLPNINKCNQSDIIEIMNVILNDFHKLRGADETFPSLLRNIAFIKTQAGNFLAPNQVFDPQDSLLIDLFYDIEAFPCPKMCEWETLWKLEQIGLKGQANVTVQDLINVATYISNGRFSNEQCLRKAKCLLKFLSNHPQMSDNERLSEIKWMPVAKRPAENYPDILPWKGDEVLFGRPCDMYNKKSLYLVGSVSLIADDSVKVDLNKSKCPSLHDVLDHLKNMEKLPFQECDLPTIAKMMFSIYQYLQTIPLCSLRTALASVAFIWTGKHLTEIENVIIGQTPFNMEPWIFSLPAEMKTFTQFFTDLGMKTVAEINYFDLLQKISQLHDGESSIAKQKRDLHIVANTLKLITASPGIPRKELPVPVRPDNGQILKMAPLENVCYWSPEDSDIIDAGIDFLPLHPDISHQTAITLGIPHLRRRMLNPHQFGVKGYGQHEPLTTRLANILEDYTDGLTVLKEIIQNADDAQATEVRFVFDMRQNTEHRRTLFDPGMCSLQGPALFAFNNASFTNEDFANIIKLGGATKREDFEKVGRFGLGFNSVYNLTDVPCFFSSGQFVAFDPHLSYLGAMVEGGAPGIRVDLTKDPRTVRNFSDQFEAFQGVCGCNILMDAAGFQGTLFRFPLRTQDQAKSSKISSVSYDQKKVMKLFRMLFESSDSILLFLQHVSKMSLSIIEDNSGEHMIEQELFTVHVSSVSGSNREGILTQTKNFLEGSIASPPSSTAKYSVQVDISDIGERLFSSSSFRRDWIICQRSGVNESLKMAKEDMASERKLNLLPVGGVALPVTHDGCPSELIKGGFFCFLPLSQIEGLDLPVHINGYFCVSSNRKYLHCEDSTEMDVTKTRWNRALMTDVICQAFVDLLILLQNIDMSSEAYYKIWPTYPEQKGYLADLKDSFIRRMCQEDLAVFQTGSTFHPMSSCIVLDDDIVKSDICDLIKSTVDSIINQSGQFCLQFPSHIQVHMKPVFQQHNAVFDFKSILERVILPKISEVSSNLRDKILIYVLGDHHLRDLLKQFDCIPVTPDGTILKNPAYLINPVGPLKELFKDADGRFPYFPNLESFHQTTVFSFMQQLGMKYDVISWEEILSRCRSVKDLATFEDAKKRAQALVKLFSFKLKGDTMRPFGAHMENDNIPQEVINSIWSTRFLPLRKKPINYPLTWMNDDEEWGFGSPDATYLSIDIDLVGSTNLILDDGAAPKWAEVARILGKTNEPEFSQVVDQLDNAIQTARENRLGYQERLLEMFNKILKWMSSECRNQDMIGIIKQNLMNRDIFYIDSCLYSPMQCCRSGFPCPPYFQILTQSLVMEPLYATLEIKNHFEIVNLISFLQKINRSEQTYSDIQAAVIICKMLAEEMKRTSMSYHSIPEDYGDIYAPGCDNKMHIARDLCYNNCPWIEKGVDKIFSHKDIPFDAANIIGIKTIREAVLDDHSEPLGEKFGQSEALTQRLHRLLTGYPLGVRIFYELLQNADDAGATEIHFVLDKRTHGTTQIFGDCWKPLQGPSLCVYNNKPFTTVDLAGIKALGTGTKNADPTKTGQYGVGFNCTYNLTDTPTIYTDVIDTDTGSKDTVLCTFDPHHCYVPGSTKEHPGRKYSNISHLKKKFREVFEAYLPDMFDVTNSTIFRFPLRTEAQAAKSAISSNPVSPEMVEENVFKPFKEVGSNSLLFLNSINNVRVTVIATNGSKHEYCNLKVTCPGEQDAEKRNNFQISLKDAGELIKQGNVRRVPEIMSNYNLSITNGCKSQNWLIIQTLGFSSESDIGPGVTRAFRDKDISLLPRGGVAFPLKKAKSGSKYIFSTLPLPLSSHCNMHVNGHFAMGYENRDSLAKGESSILSQWNTLLLQGPICKAFLHLIELIKGRTTPASLDIFQDIFPKPNDFEKDSHMQLLFATVYQTLVTDMVKCIPVLIPLSDHKQRIQWYAPISSDTHNMVFMNTLEEQFPHETQTLFHHVTSISEPKYIQLEKVLRDIGLPLASCPLWIAEAFSKAGHEIRSVSAAAVIKFLTDFQDDQSVCCLGNLPKKVEASCFKNISSVKMVLKYCMRQEGGLDLNKLPLLVTEDKMLRCFGEDPIYMSSYHDLFPNFASKFLHQDLIFTCSSDEEFKRINNNCLASLTLSDVAEMLEACIPGEALANQDELPLDSFQEHMKHILPVGNAEQWLYRLWEYLASQVTELENQCKAEADANQILNFLSPVLHLNLVPVKREGQKLLVQISQVINIVNFNIGDTTSCSLRDSLHKLPFMMLSLKFPSPTFFSLEEKAVKLLLKKLQANINNPESIIRAMTQFSDIQLQQIHEFGSLFLADMRRYIVDGLEKIKTITNHIPLLQKLPIYLKKGGYAHSKLHGLNCYMISDMIPETDLEVFQDSKDSIFLRIPQCDKEKQLLQYLGVIHLEKVEFYTKFCLIDYHFQSLMSKRGREIHLKYIKDKLLTDEMKKENSPAYNALLECLRNLDFIEDAQGSFHQASHFHDSTIKVFQAMKEIIVPDPFCQYEWLDFMRLCGLVHTISEDQFVMYARKVEMDADAALLSHSPETCIDEVRKASLILIGYMYEHFTTRNYGRNLLHRVKDIAFVPPHYVLRTLQSICPQHGSRTDSFLPFVCFSGSCLSSDSRLIWTVTPMIDEQAQPEDAYHNDRKHFTNIGLIFKDLNIHGHGNLPNSLVVQNIIKVCRAAEESNMTPQGIHLFYLKSILCRIYKHLMQTISTNPLTQEQRLDLGDSRIIAVEDFTRFVRPCDIILDTKVPEIKPYLYNIPLDLGLYASLLETLGAVKVPGAEHYASILNKVYERAGNDILENNEKACYISALNGFCHMVKRDNKFPSLNILPLPNIMREKIKLKEQKSAYMHFGTQLSSFDIVHVRLYKSTELIYNDKGLPKHKLNKIQKPFLANFGFNDEFQTPTGKLVEMLPKSLSPIMLSLVLTEELLDIGSENMNDNVDFFKCRFTADLFHQTLKRLVTGNAVKHKVEFDFAQQATDCCNALKQCKIIGCSNLQTRHLYNGEPMDDTIANAPLYIKGGIEGDPLTFYIDQSFDKTERLHFHILQKRLFSQFQILKYCGKHFEAVLLGNLRSLGLLLDEIGGFDADGLGSFISHIGSFLPVEVHHLIDYGFSNLCSDTYVVVLVCDPLDIGEEGPPVYQYAKIMEVLGSDSEISCDVKYKVLTNEEGGSMIVTRDFLYELVRCTMQDGSVTFDSEKLYQQGQSDYQAIVEQIQATLQFVLTLPEQEMLRKNNIIKRLRLKWRLDDSAEPDEILTRISEYLDEALVAQKQQEIANVERRMRERGEGHSSSSGGPSLHGNAYYAGSNSFDTYLASRTEKHRQQRNQYMEDFKKQAQYEVRAAGTSRRRGSQGASSRGRTSDGPWMPRSDRNPQPTLATLWLGQAKHDLSATRSDRAWDWICFKAQQCVEKCLVAALLSYDTDKYNSKMDMKALLTCVKPLLGFPAERVADVEELILLTSGNPARLTYPDNFRYVPHRDVTDDKAGNMIEIADRVLTWATEYLRN